MTEWLLFWHFCLATSCLSAHFMVIWGKAAASWCWKQKTHNCRFSSREQHDTGGLLYALVIFLGKCSFLFMRFNLLRFPPGLFVLWRNKTQVENVTQSSLTSTWTCILFFFFCQIRAHLCLRKERRKQCREIQASLFYYFKWFPRRWTLMTWNSAQNTILNSIFEILGEAAVLCGGGAF